ncbi:MAG: bifunctional precorrin-2 dehydrogenase/sirohydrochlorin ferrochelatase [Syntrophobacteraceae bacterium]
MPEAEQEREPYYPVFLDIEGLTCVVVGGGAVGERKALSLLRHGARVRLIARELTPRLAEACSTGGIVFAGREYNRAHLQGASLVFAATSDTVLNRTISGHARELGVFCNMATDPGFGSFIVPSLVKRGPISIAISTAGLSPAIAKSLRIKLERDFGVEWEFFVHFLGELRKLLKSHNLAEQQSRRIYGELAALPVPEWLKDGKGQESFEKISAICVPPIRSEELRALWDHLWKRFFSSSQPFAI